MARIIYAAQGEGLGHAVRAHSVGEGLLARGHDVRFVSSLVAASYLREHFPQRSHEILGLHAHLEDGQIHALKTVLGIVRGLAGHGWGAFCAVNRIFDEFQPELLISDAECFSPWVATFRQVPFISLDNQHILTHCDVGVARESLGDFFKAYAVVRGYHLGAKRYLISTFFDAEIRYQPCTFVPPILRQAVLHAPIRQEDYLVAYLGALATRGQMSAALESFDGLPVRAYGFEELGKRGNVTYMASSVGGFLQDLAGCAGVIATAGHTLIGECLYLEKPMLVVPFGGQFEQMLNAIHIRRMGVGDYVNALTAESLRSFVGGLASYRLALSSLEKASLEPVLDAIERELP